MPHDDPPVDPFLDDPDDPALLFDDVEHHEPLSVTERDEVAADLDELLRFRALLDPLGIDGVMVECADCGEMHYFGWRLMESNLRALLSDGRTHVHEPAYNPNPAAYVTWDYARGYTDALTRQH